MRLASLFTGSALLFACLLSGASACPSNGQPSAGDRPNSSALEAAFAALDRAQLKSDLEWIAADERGGRDTPSAGLEETARFLAGRMESEGFQPGARDGFLYRYPLTWRRIDLAASGLSVIREGSSLELKLGEDYYLGRSTEAVDLSAMGECVSIGDGSRSVFGKVDLHGKWAWCRDDGSSPSRIATRAQEAGAIGILFTPAKVYDREPYAERFASILSLLSRGSLGKSAPERETEPAFPSVFLTGTAAKKVHAFREEPAANEFAVGVDLGIELAETRRLTHPRGFRLFENVCALWPGSDPKLKDEVLILSAHYDHVGTRRGEVYNGADDNGSGSAGLLAIARALKAYGPMRRSVLLMWVSGEEKGLLGSHAWTMRPWLPEGMYPIADVNIDMIGRNAPSKMLITPSRKLKEEYNGLVKRAERFARAEGFSELGSADAYWRRSDHMNFADNLGLPVAFLFADVHEDYHKATDTADKIDYDKIQRCAQLLLRILDDLQADTLDLHKGLPSPGSFRQKVLRGTAQTDLEILSSGMDGYQLVHGAYPESLDVLAEWMSDDPEQMDPWGKPYVLDTEDPHAPRLLSYGADGQPGGSDEAADLVLAM